MRGRVSMFVTGSIIATPTGEDERMSCEHLVCANCAQPVVEGHCAVCRASRAEVHGHSSFGVPPQVMVLLLLVVALTALLVAHGAF